MKPTPDLVLDGKLKSITTACDPDSNEEVIVGLRFEGLRETGEAKEYLEVGAVYKGQTMDVVFAGGEFRGTVKSCSLGGMAAKTSRDDSTLITLAWTVETKATLEEMFHIYSDFLPVRGGILTIAGFLHQRSLPMDEAAA